MADQSSDTVPKIEFRSITGVVDGPEKIPSDLLCKAQRETSQSHCIDSNTEDRNTYKTTKGHKNLNAIKETQSKQIERDPPPSDHVWSLSMLPSPTASLGEELNRQHWSPIQRRGRVYREKPSLHMQANHSNSSHDHHELLAFFNDSFDTLSDADTCIQDLHKEENNETRESNYEKSQTVYEHHRHHLPIGGDRIGITLPVLDHGISNSSICDPDISPIKLAIADGCVDTNHRRVYSLTQLLPLALTECKVEPHYQPAGDPSAYSYVQSDQAIKDDAYPFADSNISSPAFFLKSHLKSFEGFTFILPCLQSTQTCSVQIGASKNMQVYKGCNSQKPSMRDQELATQRVEAAVCCFGGSIKSYKPGNSIFRQKIDISPDQEQVWSAQPNQLYEQQFERRYFQAGNHISWEVEEHPPLYVEGIPSRAHEHIDSSSQGNIPKASPSAIKNKNNTSEPQEHHAKDHPVDKWSGSTRTPSPTHSLTALSTEPPKMKYRCKLCGQPKHNHHCPYSRSIQRSIGVMVYPAVNSFTSYEPGRLAPALSDMNNFVSSDSEQAEDVLFSSSNEAFRVRGTNSGPPCIFQNVEADSPSSQSSFSNYSHATLPHSGTMCTNKNANPASSDSRKRSHSAIAPSTVSSPSSNPFCDAVLLRPEQFRAVTPFKSADPLAYQYPAIPLPYTQKKGLTDTLFSLAQRIPEFTNDCAFVLREARNKDMWDQGVAELMTQVVVALNCREGDMQLNGLKRYMLTLAVSC